MLAGAVKVKEAMERLGCSRRTIERYREKYLREGPEGLKEKRRSNNRKITDKRMREG